MSWLTRSGIKKGKPDQDDDRLQADSVPGERTTATPEDDEHWPEHEPPEVKNDRAEPVVGNERGIPSVNQRSFRSKALPLSFAAIVLAAIAVVWMLPSPQAPAPKPGKNDPLATKDQRFDEAKPTAMLTPPAPTAPPEPQQGISTAPEAPKPLATPSRPIEVIPAIDNKASPQGAAGGMNTANKRPLTPLELRKQSKMLIVGADGEGDGGQRAVGQSGSEMGFIRTSAGGRSAALTGEGEGSGEQKGQLAEALKPTVLTGAMASMLPDRTFMMTQGNSLDCALDWAISSAVPGMTKCTLSRSIFGADRKVVLLERGTVLTGQYQGGLQQGQSRIFILWTRAETPNGVLIPLASPGGDALGRGGVDGYIDTHFWDRFGAALFLSIVDDSLLILAQKAQNGSSGGNNTVVIPPETMNTAKNAASIAVENNIRIPATLYKNQGEHISVLVARDLDFRSVYALKPTETSGQ